MRHNFTIFERKFTSFHFKIASRRVASASSALLLVAALAAAGLSGCETEKPEAEKQPSQAGPSAVAEKAPGAEQETKPAEEPPESAPGEERPRQEAAEPAPAPAPVETVEVREKTPPEVGYGVKSEAQIMREKEKKARIGVLAPISGELEEYGIDASNGAELASDERMEKEGIKGMEFELLVFDTKGKMRGAQLGVEAFLDRDVLAVVGAATGEVSFSANKAVNEGQLIMISAGSRRRLGDTGPYNFRNTMDDVRAIKKLIEHLAAERGWKKFALFTSLVNDYSVKLSASFKSAIYDQNLELTHDLAVWDEGTTYMTEEQTSVARQLAKLKENTPDALIYTGDAMEGAEVVTELRKLGLGIPLVGSEDLMVSEYTSIGPKAAGTVVYGGFNANSADPKVRTFVEKYIKRFGKPPSRLAALSYDAYNMLAEAIERAKSMRPSHVREALLSIKDFHGVTGPTSISEDGEAVKDPYIFELMKKENGKYDFVCVKEPA
ncbi:MAG: ABC transporter substrate-binding protein [Candidatus Nitrospinota bacterium M3_3B_026]